MSSDLPSILAQVNVVHGMAAADRLRKLAESGDVDGAIRIGAAALDPAFVTEKQRIEHPIRSKRANNRKV